MNVGGDLVRNGAKVDGVRFHDGIKGSAGDEIEVDYLENSSKLTMEGNAEHVNVGGAVRYIPVGQDGVATKSSRVQKADIHAHMFTKLKDSKFNGGQYTNVAGNIDYVGAFESAPPPSKGDLILKGCFSSVFICVFFRQERQRQKRETPNLKGVICRVCKIGINYHWGFDDNAEIENYMSVLPSQSSLATISSTKVFRETASNTCRNTNVERVATYMIPVVPKSCCN